MENRRVNKYQLPSMVKEKGNIRATNREYVTADGNR
jgi:hypothetical protein